MRKKLHAAICFLICTICMPCGCGSGGGGATTYQVLAFSDVHFDPFYDTSLFSSLVAADASEWGGIFASSAITEPSAWGSDSNYPLLVKSLASVRDNSTGNPVVIFTGDILSHHFDTNFYALYGSTDVTALRSFIYKTVSFFSAQVREYLGSIPVMFVLGNNDAYEGDYKIEPNGAFLSDTAEIFFSNFLYGTADHQTFLSTYKAGGYYVAEPMGNSLVVIALNSVFFSTNAATGIEAAIDTELNWLNATLLSAKQTDKKVWLIMHIPPGADIFATKGQINESGQLSSSTMMWRAAYQSTFLQILSNYSDTIAMIMSGHTHMDEYRLPAVSLEVAPSISPIFSNNPAFKLMTFPVTRFYPIDYTSLNYDLSEPPDQFENYYTFSSSFSMQGLLDATLQTLFPILKTDSVKQLLYRDHYYSGHSAGSAITNLNWPVYWCGIGNLVGQDLIDCVNSY